MQSFFYSFLYASFLEILTILKLYVPLRLSPSSEAFSYSPFQEFYLRTNYRDSYYVATCFIKLLFSSCELFLLVFSGHLFHLVYFSFYSTGFSYSFPYPHLHLSFVITAYSSQTYRNTLYTDVSTVSFQLCLEICLLPTAVLPRKFVALIYPLVSVQVLLHPCNRIYQPLVF